MPSFFTPHKIVNINADFESAISATGFGKFNILVLFITFPSTVAIICDTGSPGYITSSEAVCDLNLSLQTKIAMTTCMYAGMVSSAIPWAYMADTLGRKPVIVVGLLTDAIIVIISGTSQHRYFLLFCRFVSGLCICGPFLAIYAYLAETNCNKARHPIIFVIGTYLSFGALLLPLLEMWITSITWKIEIFGYKYHSWHLFLIICGMPALIGGIGFLFVPESPKFLMTQGRNDEAMASFRRIYHMNKGKSRPFPIQSLVVDKIVFKGGEQELTKVQKVKQQFIDVIFSKTYLRNVIMVFVINFCVMMGQNTIRLWLPAFLDLTDVLASRPKLDQSFCGTMDFIKNKSQTISKDCIHGSEKDYMKDVYFALVVIIRFVIAVILVNKIGVKIFLSVSLAVTFVFTPLLYFSPNRVDNILCLTGFLCMEHISTSNIIAMLVSLFPTQVRATILSLALMVGRIGTLLGNQLFPLLINLGCLATILWLAALSVVAFIPSIFVPNATGQHLL